MTPPEVLSTFTLTDADRELIAAARRAFRNDFRYLEEILWYARGYRPRGHHTSPVEPEPFPPDTPEWRRLMAKVDIDAEGGCWGWTGGLTGSGQPFLRLGPQNRVLPVRRWIREQLHGPVPAQVRVKAQPTCQNLCVNPVHLRVTDGSRVKKNRLVNAYRELADASGGGGMSAQTMMTHRAEVSRFAEVMTHGTPARVWSVVATAVPVLYSKDQAEFDPTWEPEQRAHAAQRGTLFALPGADIAPGDRIKITRPPLGSFEVLPDPSLIPTLHSVSHREYAVRSVG